MFFLASSFTMMDATSLALVKQHNAEFGKQRILSTIGQATVPLLAGILVDAHSASLGYSDYMPAVYLGCSLALVATFIVMRLDVEVETGSGSMVQDLKQLVTRLEIDLFLLMILILGSNWGFIESYLFLYLIELKAPNYLLGLTLTVGCLTGVPVMYVADKIISKLGRPAIFIISFFSYAARHFGYAFMTDPWLVFPYELLEIFTYQIMWVAAATYCHILAPKGLLATMMGLAGSIHYSLGRGLGSLIGGYLIANMGLQGAFRIMGYISLASGIIYCFIHYFYMRKKIRKTGEEEEEENEEEEREEKEKMKEEETPMMQLGLRRGSEGFAPIQLGLRRGSEGLHFPGSRRQSDVCLP
ncbi:major facilitator superfamily domain-containing protein 6-A-like [Scylla paramamosain]|uniref:major facilitator superfamily domain-containing protein 6-A-like n=1 Tax=Scylla paramamosain TaxID=85552 RepID=UPI003083EB98